MIRYEAGSDSEILRAAHIAAVTVESANYGEWQEGERPIATAQVALRLKMDRVLKGAMIVPPSGIIGINVQVVERRISRIFAVPGVWSRVKPQTGMSVLIFTVRERSSKLAEYVLDESNTFLVVPAEVALADVERALVAGSPAMSLTQLLDQFQYRRAEFGTYFARYVAARLPELYFANPRAFQAVLKEAENPATSEIFRRIIFMETYQQLMAYDPAPPAYLARLIFGSIRAIVDGTGQSFGAPVLNVMLPNLLGLQGGLQKKDARSMFEFAPAVLQQTRDLVEKHPELPSRDRLLQWLSAP